MSGIDEIKLKELIRKIENLCESLNDNKEKIISSLNDLDKCYDGQKLGIIFSGLCSQGTSFQNVLSVLENYVLVLENVRNSYIQQDIIISQNFNKVGFDNEKNG